MDPYKGYVGGERRNEAEGERRKERVSCQSAFKRMTKLDN